MFDILRTVSRPALTEALYRVGLRMTERDRFPDWRRWLAVRPDGDADAESIAAATRLLEEVESGAGVPLAEVPEWQAEEYYLRMTRIRRERDRRELRLDPVRGRKSLEELRRMYGNPNCHAAA